MRLSLVVMLLALSSYAWSADASGVNAATLGVIVNLNDPQSVAVGEYYQKRRSIPAGNIIRIRLPDNVNTLGESEFQRAKTEIDRQTPSFIEAYVLTWLRPYRVECMSITTAIAFGFSRDFCSKQCESTRLSRYFDSASRQPMLDLAVRPTMLLAATSVQQARALIDRGVAADGSNPKGKAYLATTDDAVRNVRSSRYALAQATLGDAIPIQRTAGYLTKAERVMFYFIGAVNVANIDTNQYLPGAVADHLTSTGGALLDTDQMSSLRWLESGVTGSYGTVVEPCNVLGKFPDPLIMMKHYLMGETLVEAYWKSVLMPGQGLFIGEPLARPYVPDRHSK